MTLLLLLGCSPNGVRAKAGAPLDFDRVRSALFVLDEGQDPADGYDGGYLLLTSEEYACPAFMDSLGRGADWEDGPTWQGSGLLVLLAWYAFPPHDAGFEGVYQAGNYGQYFQYYSYYYTQAAMELRQWWGTAFADGVVWADYGGLGLLEVTDYTSEEVAGRGETEWLRFRFEATHCGELERDQEDEPRDSG